MIFHRLAELGFTIEETLNLTPHLTRTLLSDGAALLRADDAARESEIRDNIKKSQDKGRRLLVMKYQKELDEHLAKVVPKHKQIDDAMKAQIVKGIRNG